MSDASDFVKSHYQRQQCANNRWIFAGISGQNMLDVL